MSRIDDPNTNFPWDRVKAAKQYLYAVKPWWARFGEKLVIVPIYVTPEPPKRYGAMTSTDQSFRLYVDRTFATMAPLHLLAGAIEHEFQHHTRDTWRRLKWLHPDDWREFANIALDLEINSGIDAEQRRQDIGRIYELLKNSLVFTQQDFRRWDVTAPPGMDDEGWIPRMVPLPEGLSAEEYLRLLQKSQELYDNESLSEESDSEQEDAGEGEADDDGNSESGSETGSAGDRGDEESEDGANPEDDSDGQSDDPGSQDGNGSDSTENADDTEEEMESSASAASEPNSDAESGEGGDGGDADTDDDDQDSDETGQGSSSGTPTGPSESGHDGEQDADNSKPADGAGTPSAEIAKTIEEMREQGQNQMWANEIENHDDPLSDPQWKPDVEDNAKPLSLAEISAAYAELEEDVSESVRMGPAGYGLDADSQLVKWSATYRKSHGMNWDAKFSRLLSAAYTSARIKGQSDLSYSVRNPNQQPLGAILQGMHSYSPNVYVLQDVSGSMRNNDMMSRSMTAFTEITAKLLGNFGEPVTWVAADTKITDIGRASSWSDKLREKWSYGFGGTDFGDVIMDIFRGKVIHNGKRYPKADLLIISTDCAFEWPRFRPRGNCKLLIVNVDDAESAERYLPYWLDRRREFVQMG